MEDQPFDIWLFGKTNDPFIFKVYPINNPAVVGEGVIAIGRLAQNSSKTIFRPEIFAIGSTDEIHIPFEGSQIVQLCINKGADLVFFLPEKSKARRKVIQQDLINRYELEKSFI